MSIRSQPVPSFETVSAIPGRIRLRFSGPGSRNGLLSACARQLETLEGSAQVRIAAEASSVIVNYDRRRYAPARMAEAIRQTADRACVAVLRQAPANSPLRSSRSRATKGFGTQQGASLLTRLVPGQTENICARNLATDRPPGLKPLLIATAAVAISALESLPVALTGAALAMAAIPVARRAAKGVQKRQLTVDELDLANIGLVALQSEFLAASLIAWLISLGELVRGKVVARSQQELTALAAQGEPVTLQAAERLRNAPLANTRLQDNAVRAGNAAIYPVAGLAAVAFLLRRDPGVIINVLKPRYDYSSGVRFGVPVPILNALTAEQRAGMPVADGAALEKRAQAETLPNADAAQRPRPIARRSLRIARQNTGLLAGAAGVNLTLALLGGMPPPLSSLINALTITAVGGNTLRTLPAKSRAGRKPHSLPSAPALAGT